MSKPFKKPIIKNLELQISSNIHQVQLQLNLLSSHSSNMRMTSIMRRDHTKLNMIKRLSHMLKVAIILKNHHQSMISNQIIKLTKSIMKEGGKVETPKNLLE